MENANTSSPTHSNEFLGLEKKLEVESWLENSRSVDSLVSSDNELKDEIEEVEEEEDDDLEYFDIFPTMEELEDTTSVIDHYLGSMVFGKPFVEKTGLVYDKEEGTVLFEKDNKRIIFKMPHKREMFKHIDFKDIKTDCIPPFVIEGDDDNHEKTHYSDSLNIGPKYKYDKSVSKAIRGLMKMKSVIFDEEKPVEKAHLHGDKQIPSVGVFDEV
ncbi:hypothetical protein Tco_1404453 [Tanacetum coccineum]